MFVILRQLLYLKFKLQHICYYCFIKYICMRLSLQTQMFIPWEGAAAMNICPLTVSLTELNVIRTNKQICGITVKVVFWPFSNQLQKALMKYKTIGLLVQTSQISLSLPKKKQEKKDKPKQLTSGNFKVFWVLNGNEKIRLLLWWFLSTSSPSFRASLTCFVPYRRDYSLQN